MNDSELMLYALFQASALNDTLDDITVSNSFKNEFKRETNRYLSYLKKQIHKQLNDTFKVDAEAFETMDRVISLRSREFAEKTFEELGIITIE